jgi:hypothetical protein
MSRNPTVPYRWLNFPKERRFQYWLRQRMK